MDGTVCVLHYAATDEMDDITSPVIMNYGSVYMSPPLIKVVVGQFDWPNLGE